MKKIIIAIDGGGIRGILPLVLLREISKHSSIDLNQQHVQWWGTSTGAIVSGAFSIQKHFHFDRAIQQVLDLYEFRSAASIHPGKIPHPARAFNQVIDANFSGLRLKDFSQFHCVVTDVETNGAVVVDSGWGDGLDDAIRASCAFPGLFPPVKLGEKLYADGYIGAKNPSEIAFVYHQNAGFKPDLFLSLGTGQMRVTDKVELAVSAVNEKMKNKLNELGIPYYRLNPKLVFGADDMQNITPKNIHHLKQDCLSYIEENESVIMEIAELIDR
jgi:patatin-like phospholipase/acyl hydrolase